MRAQSQLDVRLSSLSDPETFQCGGVKRSVCLSRLTDTHTPDEDYALLAAYFSDRETAELTLAVALMNAWNRLGVCMPLPVRMGLLKVAA